MIYLERSNSFHREEKPTNGEVKLSNKAAINFMLEGKYILDEEPTIKG